jgi:ribosomal protein S24E
VWRRGCSFYVSCRVCGASTPRLFSLSTSQLYKCDAKTVFLFGFKTKFGGGKTTGFGLIYDNMEAVKKFEPKHRLIAVSARLAHPIHALYTLLLVLERPGNSCSALCIVL